MNAIKEICRQAMKLDACDNYRGLLSSVGNLKDLSEIFLSPQGLEFCGERNFPSLEMWRMLDRRELASLGVYVDSEVHETNRPSVVLVGDTEAVLEYDNTDCGYVVVLMHGARATVKASGYSAVFVTNCGGEVEKIIKDNALIL